MSLNDKVALVTGAGSGSARPVTGSMSSSQYDAPVHVQVSVLGNRAANNRAVPRLCSQPVVPRRGITLLLQRVSGCLNMIASADT
jgi:hypothetical protein